MFGGAMAVEPRRGHHPRLHPQSPQVITTSRSSNIDYTKSETRLYQVNVHIGSNILYNIAATYIINNPFFLTHGLSLQACRLHLSWSNTYMGDSRPYWRVAMSSTCNPPSPDTSDCRPPSFSHLHELLLPPFHLCRSFYEDSESICLDLNNLHLENL